MAGINDGGDKFFAGVNGTSDQLVNFRKILPVTFNEQWVDCRGIITAPSHAKLKVQVPPPHSITAHAWGDLYAHTCTSLCSPNGQPAIQAKYTYSTLLPAFLFGCVVYASAKLVTDFTRSL